MSTNRKFKEAEILTRKAIQLEPYSAEAYNNLGIVLKKQGEINAAINSFRKALTKLPVPPVIKIFLQEKIFLFKLFDSFIYLFDSESNSIILPLLRLKILSQ